jgi:hypothetical protein
MGLYKQLDTKLLIMLQENWSRKDMENHVYKFLLVGHGIPHPGPEDDVADLEELSLKIVSDYLRQHWWQYLINRIRTWIYGIS